MLKCSECTPSGVVRHVVSRQIAAVGRDLRLPLAAVYDAINMHDWDDVVDVLEASSEDQSEADTVTVSETGP